jgi:hypothetical protein
MMLASVLAVIVLSALGGFIAGRAHGLELALQRILRACDEL